MNRTRCACDGEGRASLCRTGAPHASRRGGGRSWRTPWWCGCVCVRRVRRTMRRAASPFFGWMSGAGLCFECAPFHRVRCVWAERGAILTNYRIVVAGFWPKKRGAIFDFEIGAAALKFCNEVLFCFATTQPLSVLPVPPTYLLATFARFLGAKSHKPIPRLGYWLAAAPLFARVVPLPACLLRV